MKISYSLIESQKHHELLKMLLPGGKHSSYAIKDSSSSIVFNRGKGSRLWDVDGNEYLDFNIKSGSAFLGHAHDEFSRELADFISAPFFTDHYSNELVACRYLQKYIPCCELMRFGLSGTEIVLNAIRLARAYTNRSKVIRFYGHYHGNADPLIYSSRMIKDRPFLAPFVSEGVIDSHIEDGYLLLPWNDIEAAEKTFKDCAEHIAAVIMEPIAINGGGIFPEVGYIERIRELCTTNKTILIFDEIITGMRMGLGGAQAALKVIPDLCVLGKAIGGGIPISVLCGKKEIMNAYESGCVIQAGTFNGYLLGLTAVGNVFRIIEKHMDSCYKKMEHIMKDICAVLMEAAKKVGFPISVQGPLTCMSIHCTESELKTVDEFDGRIRFMDGVLRECFIRHGILNAYTSRLYANINLAEDDIEFFRERITEALEDTALLLSRMKRGWE